MKKLCILFFNLISISTLFSQTIDWFETICTKRNDYAPDWNHLALAGIGSDDSTVTIAGTSRNYNVNFLQANDSLTFTPFIYGIENRFIARFDKSGKILWKTKLGGGNMPDRAAMTTHKSNTYFASVFTERAVFDADTFSTIRAALFLVKYDKQGKRAWVKISSPFFYSEDFIPRKIVVDNAENVYLLGEARGYMILSFGDKTTDDNVRQFAFKFDKNGTPQYAASMKDNSANWGLRVFDAQADRNGILYCMSSDGGLNVSSSCKYSSWKIQMSKITPSGTVQQLFAITADDLMSGAAFKQTSNGDFIITGSYRGQLRINHFKTQDQYCEKTIFFLTRVTSEGKVLWFQKGDPSAYSHGFDLVQENDYNYLFTGIQEYNTSTNKRRLFIKRVSAWGNTVDSIEYSMRSDELTYYQYKIAKSGNDVFLAGNFEYFFDSLRLDAISDKISYGQKLFLLKVGQSFLQKTIEPAIFNDNEVLIEPNPTNGLTFIRLKNLIETPLTLRLFDLNGRLLWEKKTTGDVPYHAVDIQDYANGLYFLHMQSADLKVVKKIVKQH